MHHVSSPTFSKIIDTNYARYKIGLSGTIERKDGKHVVFRDYFGHTVFKPPKDFCKVFVDLCTFDKALVALVASTVSFTLACATYKKSLYCILH